MSACYDISSATGRSDYKPALKQDVVKLEVISDHQSSVIPTVGSTMLPLEETSPAIEIMLATVSIKISNDVDSDMRKSIDGLSAVVKDQLNMNSSRPNEIYLFCGRRSDRIKVLLHEREGFVLLYKRLDANVGKYRCSRNRNEVKPITWRQFDWLMSGLEIEQPKAIKVPEMLDFAGIFRLFHGIMEP